MKYLYPLCFLYKASAGERLYDLQWHAGDGDVFQRLLARGGDSFGNCDPVNISIKWSLGKASASPALIILLFIYCTIHQ